MWQLSHSSLRTYGFAVLTVLLTLLLKLFLSSAIETQNPFQLFSLAVAVSAWYGGLEAGLLATILAAVCGDYFFVAPIHSIFNPTVAQKLSLGLFLLEGAAIAWLIAELYRAKQQAEVYAQGLQKSEELFRKIGENISQVIWMSDPSRHEILYVSPIYEKMWGRTLKSLYERPNSFLDGIHPEDRDRAIAAIQEQLGEWDEEYRIVRPDGSLRWVRSRAFAIRDRTGKVYRLTGIVEDVTDRKEIETELRQLNERYQLAAQAINGVIYEWEIERDRLDLIPSLVELLGYDPDEAEATQTWWRSRIHPDDWPCISQQRQNALAHEKHFEIEYRIKHQSDRYIHVSDRGTIVRDPQGKSVRVIGCILDISDRKHIKTQLENREQLFHTSVENMLDCFGIYTAIRDPAGKIVDFCINYVNAAACVNNSLTKEQQIGKKLCEIFPAHRESGLFEEYSQVVETGKPLVKDSLMYEENAGDYQLVGAFDIRAASFGESFVATWRDITQRKQAEEELNRREWEFKTLAENLPDIVVRINRELRHLYASPAIEKAMGISPQELIGKTIRELSFPEEQKRFWETAIQEVFSSDRPQVRELEWSMPSNNGKYYQSRLVPECDREGVIRSVLVVTRDVTHFQEAQAAWRESEERLRLALEGANLGMWDYNITEDKLSCSPRCQMMFGLVPDRAECDYDTFASYLHPDDRERVHQKVTQAIAAKEHYEIEYRIVWPNDTIRWIAAKGRTFYDESGEPKRAIAVVQDISDRKQAEQERDELLAREQEARALAQASEQQYRIVAEAIPQIVWTATPDGGVDYFNRRWLDYTGMTLNQSQGWGWQVMLHPEDVQACLARWQRSVETGEIYEIEYRFLRVSDREYRWHLGRGVPVRDRQGRIIKWFGTATDIHEQKLAAAERAMVLEREQAARAQAEAASRMKDEFLAIVSHELRSPLNAMLGWARLLRTRKFDAAKTDKALEIIERNAQAQTQLIEDLLDISRIIRGKVRLTLRPTNLVPALEAAIDTVRTTAETKQIQVESSLDTPVGLVSGDPDRLQQVVWNLLSNAVKFTPEGGRIEVWLQQTNAQAEIQVIDSGKGISRDFLPYVFERFRQADSQTTRSQGGLGLGLAIVRNLVELHGGTIHVQSDGEGKGTTFIVRLPLLKDESGKIMDALMPSSSAIRDPATSSLSGLKILIVDDEPDTREFLMTALEEYGAQVTAAASSREAIALLPSIKFDVLLSDIGMPEEDGYTLIRRIRALPPDRGGKIPAAALTAYVREEDRLLALSAGFQKHVSKPIQPIQLIAVVANLAGRADD